MWIVAVEPTIDPNDSTYVGMFPTKEAAQEFIESAYDDADEVYAGGPVDFHLSTDDVNFARPIFVNIIKENEDA